LTYSQSITSYFLITKGKTVTLQWRNLADIILTTHSTLAAVMAQTDISATQWDPLGRTQGYSHAYDPNPIASEEPNMKNKSQGN
jgi:hypothetical protein